MEGSRPLFFPSTVPPLGGRSLTPHYVLPFFFAVLRWSRQRPAVTAPTHRCDVFIVTRKKSARTISRFRFFPGSGRFSSLCLVAACSADVATWRTLLASLYFGTGCARQNNSLVARGRFFLFTFFPHFFGEIVWRARFASGGSPCGRLPPVSPPHTHTHTATRHALPIRVRRYFYAAVVFFPPALTLSVRAFFFLLSPRLRRSVPWRQCARFGLLLSFRFCFRWLSCRVLRSRFFFGTLFLFNPVRDTRSFLFLSIATTDPSFSLQKQKSVRRSPGQTRSSVSRKQPHRVFVRCNRTVGPSFPSRPPPAF